MASPLVIALAVLAGFLLGVFACEARHRLCEECGRRFGRCECIVWTPEEDE